MADFAPRRCLLVVVVAACGATPTRGIEPGLPQLAVQNASDRGLHVIAFDAHDVTGAVLTARDGMPTMTLALPGGDWLVGFDGHLVARLAHDGTLRWSRELAIDDAIVAGRDLIVATALGDEPLERLSEREALGEERPIDVTSIIGLRGDGTVAWRADGGPRTSRTHLVRTPNATIVADDHGELAVDDSGVVLWRSARRDDRTTWTLAAYVDGAGVIIVSAASAAPETAFLPRPRMPMVARLVDPRTGRLLARAELAPDADIWALADIAVVGKRVVVNAADELGTPTPGGFVYKFVVFSVGRDSLAVADAFVAPSTVDELDGGAPAPRIDRDEAVFFTRGQHAPLELTLVEPTTHRVRRLPVMRRAPGASLQLAMLHRMGDSFVVVGELSGTLVIGKQKLHADLRTEQGPDGQAEFAPIWGLGALSVR